MRDIDVIVVVVAIRLGTIIAIATVIFNVTDIWIVKLPHLALSLTAAHRLVWDIDRLRWFV